MSVPNVPTHGRVSYQVALVDATSTAQNVIINTQALSSEGGTIASTLLDLEFSASTAVLDIDTTNITTISNANQAAAATNNGAWTTAETSAYNNANQVYQQDSAVCQTGQSVATSGVTTEQTQVSADGTNLSNLLSLSSILVSIGNFMSNTLARSYS